MRLSVVPAPDPNLAYKNLIFVHPNDHSFLTANLPLTQARERVPVKVLGKVWNCASNDAVKPGTIALGLLQRGYASAMLDQQVEVSYFPFPKDKPFLLDEVQLRVSTMTKAKTSATTAPLRIESQKLADELAIVFKEQVMGMGLKLAHIHLGTTALQLEVCGMKYVPTMSGGEASTTNVPKFAFTDEIGLYSPPITKCKFVKTEGIVIVGQEEEKSVVKMLEVNFEQLGIGGLDKEFTEIFRRAFASRIYPAQMVADMGINHVRGLMLFGPPGCGKTLIARQISKALQGVTDEDKKREPKIVNGPEILSKFVGETEKNIRDLFADAEAEQAEMGDQSELHVIIFDEIDAIAKKRGSTRDGTGVHDSLVNQLLSKIDGVDALNNILLIGMTNRLDMLDPALLRPGRFEVQVEISLPDESGRVQILNIHTARMRKNGYLGEDVSISMLAQHTKNFTGAEIEGLVKGAASYAFQRQVDSSDFTRTVNPKNLQVRQADFEEALKECKPQFGNREAEEEVQKHLGRELLPFSPEFENVSKLLNDLAKESASEQSEASSLSLVSVLLCGEPGSGKTAMAAKCAYEAGFPLVRILSPDKLIGLSDQSKSSYIADIFEEAYKSTKSLILLEDLERIIGYSKIGPTFSNQVLQSLLILVRKAPPKKDRRLFILGTTSLKESLDQLDLASVFNMVLHVPLVNSKEEVSKVIRLISPFSSEENVKMVTSICTVPIPIKKLLLALEMAQKEGELDALKFGEFLGVSSTL